MVLLCPRQRVLVCACAWYCKGQDRAAKLTTTEQQLVPLARASTTSCSLRTTQQQDNV